MFASLPFTPLAPGLAAGDPAPAGWQPLAAANLVILVGVTGVGKSTLLRELATRGPAYTLLPDRRVLTDALIITQMQVADGQPPAPVADRTLRFDYTRRYRERFPGGMAAALTQLRLEAPIDLYVFDGLRGANEIEYAATMFPQARFLMLDAPDAVRVARLLGRGDAFDRVQNDLSAASGQAASFADLGVPDAGALFGPSEETRMLTWITRSDVSPDDLAAKLKIVVEERRNYDPAATQTALKQYASGRALIIDTVVHAPGAVARLLLNWLSS
jgi:hypothetical protein